MQKIRFEIVTCVLTSNETANIARNSVKSEEASSRKAANPTDPIESVRDQVALSGSPNQSTKSIRNQNPKSTAQSSDAHLVR